MNKQDLLIDGFYYMLFENPVDSISRPVCVRVINYTTQNITIHTAYDATPNTLDENTILQFHNIKINDFILLALGFYYSNNTFSYGNIALTKESNNTYRLNNQPISTMVDLQKNGFQPNFDFVQLNNSLDPILDHMNHILQLDIDKDKAVTEMEQSIIRNNGQVSNKQLAAELATKLSWILFIQNIDLDLFYRYSLLLGKKIKKVKHHFCL